MEQKLKDILNRKMDSLPLKDAIPDFDKAGAWGELSSRLMSEKRQRLPLLGWWSYAAALVGGLLIGGFAVHYLQGGNPKDMPGLSTTKNVIPAVQEPNARASGTLTLPIAHPSADAADAVFMRKDRSAVAQPSMALQKTVVPSKAEVPQQQLQQPVPEQTTSIAVAVAPESPKEHYPALRAIHLLDIESEDKTVLINDAGKVHAGLSFSFYISPSRLPEGKDAQAPSSVLRYIVR